MAAVFFFILALLGLLPTAGGVATLPASPRQYIFKKQSDFESRAKFHEWRGDFYRAGTGRTLEADAQRLYGRSNAANIGRVYDHWKQRSHT